MKKKILIPVIAVVLLLVLFLPIPGYIYDGDATREYTALSYKIVSWNKTTSDGVYQRTRVYFGADSRKSLEELWEMESENVIHSFVAAVLSINGSSVLVAPVEGEEELNTSGEIVFSADALNTGIEAGSIVKVSYKGGISETSPAEINAVSCELTTDLRHMKYPGEWLNRETAEFYDAESSSDLKITKIYSDCFFARSIIADPSEIKINGTLSREWCVGDKVFVRYSNIYRENEAPYRTECDMLSIEVSTFVPDPNMCYKPVIYLYPEEECEVSVKLSINGSLTCTYPKYNDGWCVTAAPDGTLTDKGGKTYNYLYWEGETAAEWDMSRGFCIKGEDTALFLEEALMSLGLNRREANEFIVYWLPLMEANPYNLISFQEKAYTDSARLELSPSPDTVIRVFMVFSAMDSYVETEPQTLTAPEREGFTLVEWGGTEIKGK